MRKGHTPFGIAAKVGTTWRHLADLNRLANPQASHPGQLPSID